ncbi:gag-pol polyprotein [Tanacetum coccineum]
MATLKFCDKHNLVAYLEKPEGSSEFHQIIDFLTAIELTASIDGQAKTITEASLRRHLKLEDNGGITSLPNTEIFEQLDLMGYATDSDKLTFQKVTRSYSGEDIPLFPSMITAPDTSPSRITSSPSLSPHHTPVNAPLTSSPPIIETSPTTEEPALIPHESPLQSVQSLGRDEGSVSLNELMDLVTQLTNKVRSLENELKNTKKVYGTAFTKLAKRVKKLEKQVKTDKAGRRTKIVLLEDDAVEEDSSKHGRSLIEELDMDADISLVPSHTEIQEKISDETEIIQKASSRIASKIEGINGEMVKEYTNWTSKLRVIADKLRVKSMIAFLPLSRCGGETLEEEMMVFKCYNCRGEGHYASNCTVKPRKRDAAYLQQQLQIAQEEEAGIQSTQVECEFMAAADAYEETERVKVNCTLEDTLQQASLSGTQSDNAPVYDSDGSTEVPKDENCYDHDIFNMHTHEVQYTDLQTELDRTKEKLENCIIKKEKEYAVLWNNWYTKCEECKYDKISYDKAYNDMQQKIERLQAQLGDLKGKSCDTQCASNTLDPLFQKLEDEKVSLESQVLNYAKENAHLKTTYKNLFDSIKVTQAQTNSIIDSLQKQLYDTIYDNAKLRAQLFDKVSERKGTTKGTRTNTMFTKQSILGKPPFSSYKSKLYSVTPFPKSSVLPKVDKTNALSKPVTSNSTPSTRESKGVQIVKVIASRIFRTDHSKTSRVDNVVPNKPIKSSVRTKPITASQPNVIHRQQANSNSSGFSPTRVNNTAKTISPQLARVHSKSKSSCLSNNFEKLEENHRNSLIPKT